MYTCYTQRRVRGVCRSPTMTTLRRCVCARSHKHKNVLRCDNCAPTTLSDRPKCAMLTLFACCALLLLLLSLDNTLCYSRHCRWCADRKTACSRPQRSCLAFYYHRARRRRRPTVKCAPHAITDGRAQRAAVYKYYSGDMETALRARGRRTNSPEFVRYMMLSFYVRRARASAYRLRCSTCVYLLCALRPVCSNDRISSNIECVQIMRLGLRERMARVYSK